MQLAFPFSTKTRWLFFDVRYKCFNCGRNKGVEAHHILGRVSASPFNLAPLCHDCHSEVVHTRDEHQRLFAATIRYLYDIGYRADERDEAFMRNYFAELFSQTTLEWLYNLPQNTAKTVL